MHSYRFAKQIRLIYFFLFLLLAACAAESETADFLTPLAAATAIAPTGTAVPSTATLLPTKPTAVATHTQSPIQPPTGYLFVVNPITIFSQPSREAEAVGMLATGETVSVNSSNVPNWILITCPDPSQNSCWVPWHYNDVYTYEGEQRQLTIPDPATLKLDLSQTVFSPNGQWQTEITQSETISFRENSEEWVPFFYVQLTVTSLTDGTTWVPVRKWHSYGLGADGPPSLFYWSADGRYLYFTSTHDYHGVECALYNNVGNSFARLDLHNGQVAFLPPPQQQVILTFSADEKWIAYLSGSDLVVREVATAFTEPSQNSVKWQVPLNYSWNAQISSVAWSSDNKKVLVTAVHRFSGCDITGTSTWELDVTTGIFTTLTEFIPTPEPTPIPCTVPAPTSTSTRDSYLIFCGGHDNVGIGYLPGNLIKGDAVTAEAYVNYLGVTGDGYAVLLAYSTFKIWFAQNSLWLCLTPHSDQEGREGRGEPVCVSHPQPEAGRWVHTAVTWDGQEITLFYDGVAQARTAFTGTLFQGPSDWMLTIGNGCVCPDTFEGFHGYIDEVRISSISRYDADFEPEHQFTTDAFTVGLWHFDEGQGSVTADESSLGLHGALSPLVRWGASP